MRTLNYMGSIAIPMVHISQVQIRIQPGLNQTPIQRNWPLHVRTPGSHTPYYLTLHGLCGPGSFKLWIKSLKPIGWYLCRWHWGLGVSIFVFLGIVPKREKKTHMSKVHPPRARSLHQSTEEGCEVLMEPWIRSLAVPERRKGHRYRQTFFSE